ncbi:ABC1 kinase [Trifolium pratense]|uniref:ABC1 kinase n=1 Tax=Trifolium pratense TaxID=57577 RepID=A0A2K3NJM9_TRIPR|nr:ABC1 kinase [Trifolium pratense]
MCLSGSCAGTSWFLTWCEKGIAGQTLFKVRTNFMSMPYKVQTIDDFVKQVEAGDMKLRVQVLESERAARNAKVLQMATRAARKATV